MAKNNANDNPNARPTPEPTSAANPAASVPDAGGEPAKQATASMATSPGTVEGGVSVTGTAGSASGATARPVDPVIPPAPADYEMPDDFQTDVLAQTRRWVEDNPVLAIAAAAGVGLVVGRLVMALIPEPEPPSLSKRVEKRAKQLRKEAAVYADDAGAVLAANLKKAAEALGDAAEVAAEKAEVGYEKTKVGYEKSKDVAELVADAVKAAMAGVVVKKADDWLSKVRD